MPRCRAALLGLALLAAACGGSSDAAVEVIVPPLVSTTPVLPVIDTGMKTRLQAVLAAGRARGNQEGVFAKIGDSNSSVPGFLLAVGCGDIVYGRWESLRPIVERWSATPVPHGWELEGCDVSNSFTRVGSANFPGWRTSDLLRGHRPRPPECQPPDDLAVRCELMQVKPSVALVMIGTNDMLLDDGGTIDPSGLEHFRPNLRRLIREIVDAGVIPVLSTLPPRRHPPISEPLPPVWNEAIIEVAAEEQVPLWNYWRDLQDKPQFGMSYDWLHPSVAPTGGGDLRDRAMDWGFNVRNLGALRVLEKVGRIVLDGGPPDT